MQNLISILIRYHNFWLLILLQALCLILIVQTSTHHRAVFFEGVYQVTGAAYHQRESVVKYFRLKTINDSLMYENARLREKLPEAFFKNWHEVARVTDSMFVKQYAYIPARIVNNSVNRPNNYFTLDKGRRHDIKVPSGVITSNGVAGIITHATTHYSAGISVLHRNFSLSAQIKESGYTGTLRWNGDDPDFLELRDVPRHKNVELGQKVVTSSYSRLFPENIPIGTITNYEIDPVTNFYIIKVRATVSYRDIKYAYVIINHFAEEQVQLEEETEQW